MPPRGNTAPSSVVIVRSERSDLGFPLEYGQEKAGGSCYVNAFNKGTTPQGAAVDTSGHNRSTAFAGSLTRTSPKPGTSQPPVNLRCPCLHGRPHLPSKPDALTAPSFLHFLLEGRE
jgi:hypothetical protein